MSRKNNKNYYDSQRSKRRKVFCAIFFPIIFLAGAGVSTYFIWRSCHIDIGGGIFEIKDIEGKKVLVGFNPSKTKQQIIKALGDTLTIPSDIDEIADNAFYRDGQSTIPTEINKLSLTNNVQKIGSGAFAHWTSLENLVLLNPNIVMGSPSEEIGTFEGCSNISSIDLTLWSEADAWGLRTFNGLASAGKIYIKDRSLAKLWKKIFGLYGFQFSANNWIVIPDEIFNIKEGTLYGFNPGVTDEDIKEAFSDHVLRIPNDVTKIADNAFYDSVKDESTIHVKTEINAIDFGTGELEIGKNAFKKSPFTSLSVPSTVKSIDAGAFYDSAIASLELKSSSTSLIGEDVLNGSFAHCSNLNDIDLQTWESIPANLGEGTFNEPAEQGTIHIFAKELATEWKNLFGTKYGYIFDSDHWKVEPDIVLDIFDIREGVLYGFTPGITDEQILEAFPDFNMIIPEEVQVVNENAFCKLEDDQYISIIPDSMQKITFAAPENITNIGSRAFWAARGIEQVNINEMTNISVIDDWAFGRCEALMWFGEDDTTLAIPTMVDGRIGTGAFYGCMSIEAIKLPIITNDVSVGTGAFTTTSTKLKTLDLSNLSIAGISGEGFERQYTSGTIMQWMDKSSLFSFIKPEVAHEQNKIILPIVEGGLTISREEAFLLASSKQESYTNATNSAFRWLCDMCAGQQESLNYLINEWDLTKE